MLLFPLRDPFGQVESVLQVKSLKGWYDIAPSALLQQGGNSLLKKCVLRSDNFFHNKRRFGNSFQKMLKGVYPDHPWDARYFSA